MDDLTGGTHIVVVAIDLDQTGIGTFTVPVEVQASIFLVDPVFQRCDAACQLAVCIEVISALGHQVMRPGNVVIAIAYHFTLGIHIVVIIANFDEARIGQCSVDVVMQNAIFLDNTILRSAGQLSVFIERVVTGFLQAMRPGDPVHAIGHDLAVAADIVEVTVDFNQADIGYLAVDIVTKHAVIVLYDAILVRCALNELALCVKGIGSFLHQTVHSGAVVGLVHDQLALAVGIVVIVTDLDHACRNLDAVNIVEEVFAILQDPVLVGVLVMQNDAVLIEVVAPLRKRKAIGLMEPAILAVQHSTLYCSREGQALTLLQILLNREVIIVDLAVLLDNALQTGFFFDDAAVEPIGIIFDGVNAGNVLLEHAVRGKDAAGFLSRILGRQCLDAGSRVPCFGIQIVGLTVDDCPAGLLQFAVLVVLLAGCILKPTVPELPLCIQRHISGQLKDRAFIGIGSAATIGGGVPAGELVVLTGKGVGIQGSVHTDLKGLSCHLAHTTIGVEGDGVEHTGSCRVLCRISSILFSNHDLRTPTGEGVAVAIVRSLIRAAPEGRHSALQIIFLCCDLAINHPSDMCAGLGGFLTLFQQLIADRAVGVAGVTGCRKRCFDRIANLRLMAGSRNHFLFNSDFIANGAMLAFRQARLGAGRCLCCINNFGMALGRNLSLCNEDLIAHRAVLTLGLAGRRAGRLNCRINDLGMSLGGDHFLCNEYSIADGAVLAFGQTSLGAGSRNSRVNDFGMARRRDLFHAGYRSAADGALRTSFMTSLGAGSGLFRNFNRGMPGCIDCFGLGCIANCAGVGLDTGIFTGRRGRDLAIIPAVALGGDLFLCFDHRSADRAANAIRQPRFGTGCGLARNGLLSVAGRGDLGLCNENFVADGAVLAFGLAGLSAGCLNGSIDDLSVALSLNSFTLGNFLAADSADRITGVAVLGAGGILLVDHLGERMVVLPLGIKSGVLG